MEWDTVEQSRRWDAAIAGMIEVPAHAILPHERVEPIYSLGQSCKCWKVRFPDGAIGWAAAGDLDPDQPTYYVPPEIGNECLLKEAERLGRGTEWAELERHSDCGRARREMCRAILAADPERRKQLDDSIAK